MAKDENKEKVNKLIQSKIPENMYLGFELAKSNVLNMDFSAYTDCYAWLVEKELIAKGIEDYMDMLVEFGRLTTLKIENDKELKLVATIADFFPKITKLNIQNVSFVELPQWVFEMKKINWLIIENTALESIGEGLANLVDLESLELKNNKLKRIPDVFENFPNLIGLILEGNQLETIPDSICHTPFLEHLSLEKNPLKKLPKDIGKASFLMFFNLQDTLLTQLPKSMLQLSRLKQLRVGGTPVSKNYKKNSFDTLRHIEEIHETILRNIDLE